MLAQHPQVRAVITGHVHQEASGRCGGADVHTSPAVGPQFRPHTETLVIDPGPPAYRIIELHPDGRLVDDRRPLSSSLNLQVRLTRMPSERAPPPRPSASAPA